MRQWKPAFRLLKADHVAYQRQALNGDRDWERSWHFTAFAATSMSSVGLRLSYKLAGCCVHEIWDFPALRGIAAVPSVSQWFTIRSFRILVFEIVLFSQIKMCRELKLHCFHDSRQPSSFWSGCFSMIDLYLRSISVYPIWAVANEMVPLNCAIAGLYPSVRNSTATVYQTCSSLYIQMYTIRGLYPGMRFCTALCLCLSMELLGLLYLKGRSEKHFCS